MRNNLFSVDRHILKKYGAAFLIFVNGGMVFINLSYFKYGSPNPFWEGSGIKFLIHCAVAIFCAVWLIRQDNTNGEGGDKEWKGN